MNLKEERLSRGWSLEEASALLGIDIETLIMLENNPKYDNKWAKELVFEILELNPEDNSYMTE